MISTGHEPPSVVEPLVCGGIERPACAPAPHRCSRRYGRTCGRERLPGPCTRGLKHDLSGSGSRRTGRGGPRAALPARAIYRPFGRISQPRRRRRSDGVICEIRCDDHKLRGRADSQRRMRSGSPRPAPCPPAASGARRNARGAEGCVREEGGGEAEPSEEEGTGVQERAGEGDAHAPHPRPAHGSFRSRQPASSP